MRAVECSKAVCPLAEVFDRAGVLQVGRLTLHPGDVLVARVDPAAGTSAADQQAALEAWQRQVARLFPGIKAMILAKGVALEVVRKSMIEEIGHAG